MGAVVSLGSINADFAIRVAQLPRGAGTAVGRDLLRTSGGKAANVAVLARRLGADAHLIATVGDDDLATQALDGPRRAGVDVRGVRRTTGATGLAAITVPPDGDKSIVLAPNANDAWPGPPDAVAADVAAAPTGSVLAVDLEVPPRVVAAAVAAASRAGFDVVLDPSPPERSTGHVLAGADHVTPDHREAEALTGIDATELDGALAAARALRRRGAGVAYVKLPAGGCAAAGPDGDAVVELSVEPPVVDATGAGDAFAGALSWALLRGHDWREAAACAVAASACAVGAYGSQESYPGPDQLAAARQHVRHRAP